MKKPEKPAHKYAHLAGTYASTSGSLYRVALASGDTLTQQRRQPGGEWEEPYPQEARYIEGALKVNAFTPVAV